MILVNIGFGFLYTDGSRMGNQVAAAVVYGNVTKTTRLLNNASIFRAELHAISLAQLSFAVVKRRILLLFSDSYVKTGSYKWI